jgi:hypothetical protein
MTPFLAELQIRSIVKEVIEKHLSAISEPISIDLMDFNILELRHHPHNVAGAHFGAGILA